MPEPLPDHKPPRKPGRLTRRRLLIGGLTMLGAGTAAAAYARWIEPRWIRIVRRDLPVAGLPPAWDGVRVALIADLHHCPWVPLEYLAGAMEKVKALQPDLVAVAGDFILSLDPVYGYRVAGLFKDLAPPLGVLACLGNHDYGIARPKPDRPTLPPLRIAEVLPENGVRVLRNEAMRLTRDGQDLWIVGVEDCWNGPFQPDRAMAGVPADAALLSLCHNPDAAEYLDVLRPSTILSGHTHGGQIQIPLWGPILLPVVHRDRYEGLHRVGRSWLYINRGLGWIYKVRFNCRPEITVLTLRPADQTQT